MKKEYLSFNNSQKEKDILLSLIAYHDNADNWLQGIIWDEERQKGCSIGCINKKFDMPEISDKYKVPLYLVKAVEEIFENVSVEESKSVTWTFWNAMPVGMDDDYFKALYHSLCVKQTKVLLKIEDLDSKLKAIIYKSQSMHKKQADDFDIISTLITRYLVKTGKSINYDLIDNFLALNSYEFSGKAEYYLGDFSMNTLTTITELLSMSKEELQTTYLI